MKSIVRSRNISRRALAVALAASAGLLAACSSDNSTSAGPAEVEGSPVAVGSGTARTYIAFGSHGVATLGVKLTSAALDGLPTSDAMWMLPLPATVPGPWDHVMLNWNAQGHPPAMYQVPHFDFHFYIVDATQQAAITGGADTVTVPAQYVPKDYMSGVQSVPDMGVHWVDTLSAEFHGHPFDKTYIYGFSRGSMVFVEPMVTRDLLASHPDVSAPVKQPQAFQKPGAYPLTFSIRYDASAGVIRVALDSLTIR